MTEKGTTTAERLEECRRVLLVRHFNEGDAKLIRVPLHGKYGEGRHMILDADVWRAGRGNGWPADWRAYPEKKSGRIYVSTCQSPVSKDTQPVSLARLIMEATPGEAVAFVDGNTLNLRKSNLKKMPLSDFRAQRFGRAKKGLPFVEVEETATAGETDLGVPW